jgi:hypothetical protein
MLVIYAPPPLYAHSANLNASVPHCGMPFGKSFFWPALALVISLSSKLPSCNFSCNYSKGRPWITSKGSITLPRDLDILRPWASRIIAWHKTSLNGTFPVNRTPSITIRATQKKRISHPVSSTKVYRQCKSNSGRTSVRTLLFQASP